MKLLLALSLLSCSLSRAVTVDDLLVTDGAEFVRINTEGGLLHLVLWLPEEKFTPLMLDSWADQAHLADAGRRDIDLLRATSTATEAKEMSEFEAEPLPILMIDVSGVHDLRALNYKDNRVHRHLRRIARAHGISYQDRPATLALLRDKYKVDLVRHDHQQVFVLRPERFKLLSFKQTLQEHLLRGNQTQVDLFERIRCAHRLGASSDGQPRMSITGPSESSGR